MQLIICSRILNQFQNWILRELVPLWVLVVPTLSSYTILAWVMRVKLSLGSLLCIRASW